MFKCFSFTNMIGSKMKPKAQWLIMTYQPLRMKRMLKSNSNPKKNVKMLQFYKHDRFENETKSSMVDKDLSTIENATNVQKQFKSENECSNALVLQT